MVARKGRASYLGERSAGHQDPGATSAALLLDAAAATLIVMIGIVVVSHSRRLAEAAVELALQMVHGTRPAIEIAAGLDGGILGTDAADVWAAIQRAATPDGVLVLMDLGSAVLSAELAIELAGDDAPPIVLSEAPIVEGLVAAVVAAAGGATLAEVATEAANTAEIKAKLLGVGVPVSTDGELARISPPPAASVEVALHNAHGLHARPAARLVETVRRFDAEVAVRNVTVGGPLVNARSISAVSTIGAVAGHHIEIQASGRQAREALAAVVALVRRNFDDNVRDGATRRTSRRRRGRWRRHRESVSDPSAASLPLDLP